MPTLWDTVWVNNETSAGTIGDWRVADPLVEVNNQGGLQALDDIGTAMLLALFSNARLPDSLVGRGFTPDEQRTYHGNTFDIDTSEGEEELGSRLWELERAPLTIETQRLAEHYAALAIQTLVRQKKISSYDITSEIDKINNRLNLRIVVYTPSERTFFADIWTLR